MDIKDEYTYPDSEDDLEWWAESRMNIRDVRSLYSSISYYIKIWLSGDQIDLKMRKNFLKIIKKIYSE